MIETRRKDDFSTSVFIHAPPSVILSYDTSAAVVDAVIEGQSIEGSEIFRTNIAQIAVNRSRLPSKHLLYAELYYVTYEWWLALTVCGYRSTTTMILILFPLYLFHYNCSYLSPFVIIIEN